MATIEEALRTRLLAVYGLPAWETRLPIRPLYIASGLYDLVDNTAAFDDPGHAIRGRTLSEHMQIAFNDFRCTENPLAGDLRRMLPTREGIWSVHAPGLRIYGWCPGVHEFLAVTAALEIDTKKDRRLNDAKRNEVVQFARTQSLAHTILRGDRRSLFPKSAK